MSVDSRFKCGGGDPLVLVRTARVGAVVLADSQRLRDVLHVGGVQPAAARRARDARHAGERGVGIVPGTLFFTDGRGVDRVRLSFSMVDEARIDEGIERVAALLTPSA